MDKRNDAAKSAAQNGGVAHDFEDVAMAYMMAADGTHQPDVKAWIARYPHFAKQLAELASFTLMTQNAPEDTARTSLSPRMRAALDAAFAAPVALPGLIVRAKERGMDVAALGARLHVSRDVVLKLDSRVVEPASIPARLKRMLAETLAANVAQIDAFFAAPAAPSIGVAYKAPSPPKKTALTTFADALRTSKMLSAEDRAFWEGE